MKTRIAIHGAAGRMGQRLVALGLQDAGLSIVATLESATNKALGRDAGEVAGIGPIGVPIRSDLPLDVHPEVVIDFSSPEGTVALLTLCRQRKLPIVIATTGHSPKDREEIASAAHEIAILLAPNLSLVVSVLFHLTRQAAKLLNGRGYDVEIIERHHRFKKDSPSGTALYFARIIQEQMGQTTVRHGREGLVGERPAEEIGIHAIRAGDSVGEHTIIFSALGETMELVHKGSSRDSYARGALQAAKYLAGKAAGMYSMDDVLGL
jgi:4-hydroxy-tetrahydrodipicolinate reductase